MAVPRNKYELLKQSHDNFEKMNELINSYSDEERFVDFLPGTMNRNIRDVLAHLYHWHLMFINWYNIGMEGNKPEMPAKGYTWKNIKELNKNILKKYQNHKFEEVKNALDKSHSKLNSIIKNHTDEELFEKKRYQWTGSSSLATYIRSNTLSHYNWAYNIIRKGKKK